MLKARNKVNASLVRDEVTTYLCDMASARDQSGFNYFGHPNVITYRVED